MVTVFTFDQFADAADGQFKDHRVKGVGHLAPTEKTKIAALFGIGRNGEAAGRLGKIEPLAQLAKDLLAIGLFGQSDLSGSNLLRPVKFVPLLPIIGGDGLFADGDVAVGQTADSLFDAQVFQQLPAPDLHGQLPLLQHGLEIVRCIVLAMFGNHRLLLGRGQVDSGPVSGRQNQLAIDLLCQKGAFEFQAGFIGHDAPSGQVAGKILFKPIEGNNPLVNPHQHRGRRLALLPTGTQESDN